MDIALRNSHPERSLSRSSIARDAVEGPTHWQKTQEESTLFTKSNVSNHLIFSGYRLQNLGNVTFELLRSFTDKTSHRIVILGVGQNPQKHLWKPQGSTSWSLYHFVD